MITTGQSSCGFFGRGGDEGGRGRGEKWRKYLKRAEPENW